MEGELGGEMSHDSVQTLISSSSAPESILVQKIITQRCSAILQYNMAVPPCATVVSTTLLYLNNHNTATRTLFH